MGGKYANWLINEAKAAADAIYHGGCYKGAHTKKESKIHVAIRDPFGVDSIRNSGDKRCECGGWTFSTIWGGEKMVCRHCGRQYFRRDFEMLLEKKLTPAEREDRKIFAMLLAGGDLREHHEDPKLILKDRLGVPAGELPIEFARHLADTYLCAAVIEDKRIHEHHDELKAISLVPVGV